MNARRGLFLGFVEIHVALGQGGGGQGDSLGRADFVPDAALTPLFEAAVRAIDEAVVNALVANEAMTGRDGHSVRALPHDAVRALLREHNRLAG